MFPLPFGFSVSSLFDFLHRKAAKREILLCDYDGCGKIFSNRQYLNVSDGGTAVVTGLLGWIQVTDRTSMFRLHFPKCQYFGGKQQGDTFYNSLFVGIWPDQEY